MSINIKSEIDSFNIQNNIEIKNKDNNTSQSKRSLYPSFLSIIFSEYYNNAKEEANEIRQMNENCLICEEPLTLEELNNNFIECFHGFCNDCYYNYFKEKINNNEVENIQCPNKDCNETLYNDFIEQKLENDIPLLEKYIKFRERKQLMRNPNIQLCPYPDCESYAKKECNNNVKCIQNGHKFCFNCLKDWHGNEPCKIDMDKSFVNWRDSKKVKRYPKCKYFIEKNEGCNHITCFNCKYEWCWLCKQKYNYGHFGINGNCFGLQNVKNSCFSNKFFLFFYKFLILFLKIIGFAIFAPFAIYILIYKKFPHYYIYYKCAKIFSYGSIIMLCLSTFYLHLSAISSIISILMIFVWPLRNKIFSYIKF